MKKVKYLLILVIAFIVNYSIPVSALEDGDYFISSKVNPNKAIDLDCGRTTNGNIVHLYSYNDSDAQVWNFKYNSEEDYYTITISKNKNYSLDVAGGIGNNRIVQLYQKNNGNSQKWKLKEDENGYYSITTLDERYAIDLLYGETKDGTTVQIYQSNNSNAQKFSITKYVTGTKTIDNGIYTISSNTGNLVSIENGLVANNSNIVTTQNNDLDTQKWVVNYLEDGYYSIKSYANRAYSLNVNGDKKVVNTNIDLLTSNNKYSQKWIIKDNGDNTYSIISKNNGLSVDTVNNNVLLDNNNHKFTFTKLNIDLRKIEDGDYFISSKVNPNKAIDLDNGRELNGNIVHLYSYNDSAAQVWNFKYNSEEDYYTITISKNKNYSLDVKGGVSNNRAIQLYQKNNNNSQKWKLIEDEDGYYSITTLDERYAIDLLYGETKDGTTVQIYQNNNTNAQKFSITKYVTGSKTIDNGIYTISSNDGNLVSIENGNVANNSNIVTTQNSDLKTQKWIVNYLNDGYYSIKSYAGRTYSLNVNSDKKVVNTNIDLLTSNNKYSQKWIIKDNGDNTYSIISKNNGLGIDVVNNNVQLSKTSQKFTLTKLDINLRQIEDGDYYITSSIDSNKAIDLDNGRTTNGNIVHLYSYNDSAAQLWNFKYNSEEDYYTITISKNKNYVLDVKGGVSNNRVIQLYQKNNNNSQKWRLVEDENGYYTITTIDERYAIDLLYSSTKEGTTIQIYQSNNSSAQKFAITKKEIGTKSIQDGVYKITNNEKAVTANNSNVATADYTNSTSQKWIVRYLNNGFYSLSPLNNTSKSINISGNKRVKGTNVELYSTKNTETQRFIIKDNDDGTYSIIAKNSGLYFDNINNNIQLNKKSNDSTQKFVFEEVNFGEQTISDGTYFITSKINNVSSLNVSSPTNNTNVYIYSNKSYATQKWEFRYLNNGYYAILSNSNNNFALTSLDENISNIVLKEYNNLDTQKWIVLRNSDNSYTILNKNYNAIDLNESKTTNNNNVGLYTSNNTNAQKYNLYKTASGISSKLEDGYYFIESPTNDNYVLEADLSTANGNDYNIRMNTKTSKKNQKWKLRYLSNSYYILESGINNSLVMDVANSGQTNGTNVHTWANNGSYAQQWILKDAGDGTFYIVTNCGNMYLDSNNTNTISNITVNTFTGNDSQKFKLSKTRLENLVIDISAHNGEIDWNTVKNNAGIYGVILRVAAGSANEDSRLAYNVSKVKELGIPYGIYLYSYAENQNGTVAEFGTHHEAKLEALRILESISKYDLNPTLGIYYDLEVWENKRNAYWSSTDYSYLIEHFDQAMAERGYPGWKIYANLSMANSVLAPWRDRITWIAQWNDYCTYTSYYNLWQYTSEGSIPGVNGNVDLNIYFID